MFQNLGKEKKQISDLDIEFMDLHLKLVDLSLYYYCIVLGLAMVTLPGADFLQAIAVANERYISLKYSINDTKARYMELKKTLDNPL